MNFRARTFAAALSIVLATSLSPSGIFAQPAPTTAQPTPNSSSPTGSNETQLMERLEVTGSYLPAAANSVAIPVIGLDANAIEHSGTNTSVLDVLRKTVPQFSGNLNLGPTNGNVANVFTNGGSQLALRNAATLVLINGRRMAYAPVDATGG